MNRLCCLFMIFIMVMLSACGSNSNENFSVQSEINEEENQVSSAIENKNETLNIQYGDKTTIQGTIEKSATSPSSFVLKLDNSYFITINDAALTEEFSTDTLFFYDEIEANGNYKFDTLLNKRCTVTAIFENYRGAGNLYLLNPTIKIDGIEAEKNKKTNKKYSSAPLLANGEHILPESFSINGRVSLDKVSYGYTEGNTPKDPYRLSLVLKPTDNNWYFIHRIYMDVLIFDENDEQIKQYHTEYAGHELSKNLQVIENLGFDNLNPHNQGYQIKENWNDFPQNAHSAAILLSFDVFAKIEFGIYSNGNNVTVAPYELRYVEPQVFDSYVDINNGRIFEHH